MNLRYVALRSFTVGATTYAVGDVVDVSSMSANTLSGLSAMGWVGTVVDGNIGAFNVSATAPTSPATNDIWVDIS